MSRINVILICSFFKKIRYLLLQSETLSKLIRIRKLKLAICKARGLKLFSTAPRHQLIPNFKNSTNKLRRMVEVKLKSCPVRRRIYACCILFNRPDLFEAFGI